MEIFANLVGVTFRGAEAKEIVKHLTPGDGNLLALEPEPDNEYDSNAVRVVHKPTGTHVGYIARENNYEVFKALQRGEELNVEIVGFENTLKPTLLITDQATYLEEKIIELLLEIPCKELDFEWRQYLDLAKRIIEFFERTNG